MKEKKDLHIKILIAVICILAAISVKLFLELKDYKDLERRFPFYNPVFTKYAQTYHLQNIEEYEYWISQVALEKEWKRDISLDHEYQKYTWEWCQILRLDYNLILALMYHESRFDVDAYSRTHDIGLMQINRNNKEWANTLAKREINLKNPYDNILAGLLIYNHYQNYWIEKGMSGAQLNQYTLNSYNMGITGYTNTNFASRSYDRRIQDTAKEIKE